MAEVFAARLEGPQQFARACVIKCLRRELAQMPQQVQLFLEEARLSAMLVHPCVVQVFDVGEALPEDGRGAAEVFFAMERIDGPPLSRLLEVLRAEREPLPLDVVVWIGARVAEGLHFAHELVDRSASGGAPRPLHIVHRDVSPQNVLISSGGEVKVADFGIATSDTEHRPRTRIGVTKGKLAYMSPEQARGERVDRRTDVYALGALLWEMLAGRPLYEDLSARRRQEAMRRSPRAQAPSELRPEVDEVLDRIVCAALEPVAKDRSSDCRALEEALDAWLEEHRGGGARGRLQELLAEHRIALSAPEQPAPAQAHAGASAQPGAVARLRDRSTVNADDVTLVKKAPKSDGRDSDDERTRPMMDAIVEEPATGEAQGAQAAIDAAAHPARDAVTAAMKAGRAVAVKAGRAAVALPALADRGAALPSPSTSFVGRQHELAAVRSLFDDGARIVTLLGPGGAGKTRIALRFAELSSSPASAAARIAGAFPGGSWFADLAGANDDASAQSALARALGLPLRAGKNPLEAQAMLGHALAALGRCLVVVDHCDGIAGRSSMVGAGVIADLARRSPRTRFLATSPQALRAPGEVVLEVPPLSVPAAGLARIDELEGEADAVELFLERARAARNGRALSDAARGLVVEIVRKLGGSPLAIELAAARTATETPAEIFERLGQRGAQPPTLQAAIGETWAQLGDDERRAFRQSSVFRDGFDLDAADAVLELGDDEPRAVDVLERLKGRSLMVARPQPLGPRFLMLEALRGFAEARLDEAGERTATEARHAGFYASLGKKLAGAIVAGLDRDGDSAGQRLSLESDNIAAIVERAAAAPRPSAAAAALALEAALCLEPVLSQRAAATEQLALLDKAMAVAEGRAVSDELRLRALLARGEARRLLGSLDQARADLQAAIEVASALEDKRSESLALAGLGALALAQAKLELADQTLLHALALAESVADDNAAGRVLAQLGKVSRLRRRLEEAEERGRRAVQLCRKSNDARSAGRALVELASTLLARRSLEDAGLSASAAAQILAALNDRRSLVHAWGTLAIIELDRERFDASEGAAARAVELAAHVGDRKAHGLYLGVQACARHGNGELLEARELYERAQRMLFEVGEDGQGAFLLGAHGAVQAALDDVPAATQAFTTATRRLRVAERPLLHIAVGVLEGMLLLARAGDESSRQLARAEIGERVTRARAAGFEESEEVRFAVRLVDGAVRR